MHWIHQSPKWPHFTWDASALTAPLADVRFLQGKLLGSMHSLGFDAHSDVSLSALTEEIVNSSEIEGELLRTDEVRSSIARKMGWEIQDQVSSGRYVDAVVAMTLDATQHYDQALTVDRLFAWHSALFPTGHSGILPITVGDWRQPSADPMQVVSGPIGRETVHFEAVPASSIPREMKQFLHWFETETTADPVLKAGIAHFWMVTIHPFEDGNGRIARAITEMALSRSDHSRDRFYSMSAHISQEREVYYQKLESQQRGDEDLTEWLEWFLTCLKRSLISSEDTLQEVFQKAIFWKKLNVHPINPRQTLVLNRMMNHFKGYINTSKYAKLAKCSTDTALRDIRLLLEWGALAKNPGKGRSSSYRLRQNEPSE